MARAVGDLAAADARIVYETARRLSLFNLGLAVGTLPVAFVMRHLGHRTGYVIGATIGMGADLTATLGIALATFAVFSLGTFAAGFYPAHVQTHRFAGTDGATGTLRGKATARVTIGGLTTAVIGPQLVIWTRDALVCSSMEVILFASGFIDWRER